MPVDEPEQLRCPVCGRLVASVTVVGPDVAIVAPCGHRFSPGALDGDTGSR